MPYAGLFISEKIQKGRSRPYLFYLLSAKSKNRQNLVHYGLLSSLLAI